MGKLPKLVLLTLVLGIGLLAWSHVPVRLSVKAERPLPTQWPSANPPAGMYLTAFATGQMQSGQAFAYRGGSFLKASESAMDVVMVRHPKGNLLIDSGFGSDVDTHVAGIPWLMRTLSKFQLTSPVAEQLKTGSYPMARIKGVVITHAHWDHVSGLPDLSGIPVWTNAAEREFIESDSDHSALMRSFGDTINYQIYQFNERAYMGYERSLDVYGDGSIVLVPMAGHTPGSTGVFVTLPSGKRFFFVGDIVWKREGYERPAERPFMAQRLIGDDGAAVRKEIVHLHRLHKQFPQLILVPAHDRRQFSVIENFPAVTQ